MASTNPTPDEARQLLAMTAGAAGSLRAAGQNRHAQWLTGLATSTFMFYIGLSTIPDDTGGLVLCGAYMLTAAVLAFALLRGAVVTKEGMPRRWWVAIRGWGIAYGVTLIVGLTWLR